MPTRVYLSSGDEVVSPEHATVSVYDRGFLYGDSIYETLRTCGGRPVEMRRHLERLRRSGEGIGFAHPYADDALWALVQRTHEVTGNAESKIRIVITRGLGELALDTRKATDPLLVIFAEELVLPEQASYRRGIAAAIVDVRADIRGPAPGLKTGNYLRNILALRLAIEAAGEDAIMTGPDGMVTEGATSNVFCVIDGEIVTPPIAAGLLEGITRAAVVELARAHGFAVAERPIEPAALRAASEVFLTSSIRGIMPVTRLDGRAIGRAVDSTPDGRTRGVVGPVVESLWPIYDAYLRSFALGQRQ